MKKSKELDQFYTTRDTASYCLRHVEDVIGNYYNLNKSTFLEPSAGDGAFIDALNNKGYSWVAGDIDPHCKDVLFVDFLSDYNWDINKETDIIIGNPPFGKRSSLAIDFINKGLSIADTVAFILPIQFNKYLTQKKIDNKARLISSIPLEPYSFMFNGKSYDVRSVFQIWTTRQNIGKDQRKRTAPPTQHKDFTLDYYNCVPEKLHLFDKQWDFAVLRQGWGDFIPLELDDYSELSTKKQWMFFKAENEEVKNRLKNIDFNTLAEKNTSVRGFGKADVIEEYNRLYEK